MTDFPIPGTAQPRPAGKSLLVEDAQMKKPGAAENRFETCGMCAIVIGIAALAILLTSILGNGLSSFRQTFLSFPVALEAEALVAAEASIVRTSRYRDILGAALIAKVGEGGSMPVGMEPGDVAAILSEDAASTLRDFGLARALGETAPLLPIGMAAFVAEYPDAPPEGLFDPARALPVQIYDWTQRSDPAFVERASGAIIVLPGFLPAMNAVTIPLRRRFEQSL